MANKSRNAERYKKGERGIIQTNEIGSQKSTKVDLYEVGLT